MAKPTPEAKTSKKQPKTPAEINTAIKALEADIKQLTAKAMESLGRGAQVDTVTMREIRKAQNEKNRLILSKITSLLRIGHPEAKTLVDKLVALEG